MSNKQLDVASLKRQNAPTAEQLLLLVAAEQGLSLGTQLVCDLQPLLRLSVEAQSAGLMLKGQHWSSAGQ
jgi:hypothetical protein